MIFQLKKFLVWSLESVCTVKDRTLGHTDKLIPEFLWDRNWNWLSWVYGCNLASVSAELDEKWGIGHWKKPGDSGFDPDIYNESDDDE